MSEYTKVVLKKRIKQSKNIVFVRTKNSVESDWVKFELDYARAIGKPIYYIDLLNDNTTQQFQELIFDLENEIISLEGFHLNQQ
uniref:TIR domain-containing protein n=1 Tax=Paenibacillus sp. FSL K6-2441 TaxID=2954679 RepID=UPI00403F5583